MIDQMYLSADMDAVLAIETKLKLQAMLHNTSRFAREQLCNTCINVLAHYRRTVSTASSTSQFVLPEVMKVYPLMVLSLLKTPALLYMEDIKLDNKVANAAQLASCGCAYLLTRAYARVFSVAAIIDPDSQYGTFLPNDEAEAANGVGNFVCKPCNIPASVTKMPNTDAYIISNSDYIYIYVPKETAEEQLLQASTRGIDVICRCLECRASLSWSRTE